MTNGERLVHSAKEYRTAIRGRELADMNARLAVVAAQDRADSLTRKMEEAYRDIEKRTFWGEWGILLLFEEVAGAIEDSRLYINDFTCVLKYGFTTVPGEGEEYSYIIAKVFSETETQDVEVEGFLPFFKHKTKKIVPTGRRLLAINDEVVDEKNSIEDLVLKNLKYPKRYIEKRI